jgi:Domain of unknown function (DUF1990)
MARPSIALRWPVGVLLTGWSYMWRTTPMWRTQVEGAWPDDGPPDVDPALPRDGVQLPEDGVGPLFRRRYRARIHGAQMDAAVLMEQLQADPNLVAPGTLAHFAKERGDERRMRVGDEFVVRMPGPWDGPVRVIDLAPGHFRFATLNGHLEAGQIQWAAEEDGDALVFGIESWARPGDRVSDLMHNRLRMAKEVQLHMWTSVIERVGRLAGARLAQGLDIETRLVAPEDVPAGTG